jgi:hypothetical protein
MNGERYRGASLRFRCGTKASRQRGASAGGAGYSDSHIVLERMIAIAGPPQRGRFLLAAQLQCFVPQLLVAYLAERSQND